MNAEDKELRTRAKKKGACRVYLNRFTRNIYYIDLIDFSSKQNRWIREAARTHRPVTRSVAKKAADAKHLRA